MIVRLDPAAREDIVEAEGQKKGTGPVVFNLDLKLSGDRSSYSFSRVFLVSLGGGELTRGSVAWRCLRSIDRIRMVVRVERIGVAIPTPLLFRRRSQMTSISVDKVMAISPANSAARRSRNPSAETRPLPVFRMRNQIGA